MATGQVGDAETASFNQVGPIAREAPMDGQCPDDASTCSSSTAAAAVVLDKLAEMDVARRAERERRREESRAAADPRESVARFLRSFAARQRNVEEALQRMLLGQGQTQQQQQQEQQPQQDRVVQSSPNSVPADPHAPEPIPQQLAVSTATPDLVQSSLELLSAEVLSLEQASAAASYYLPAYDQKQCAVIVAALRGAIEGARASLAPRRRFAFGSKKVNKVRGEEVSAAASAIGTGAAAASAAPPPAAQTPAAAAAAAAASDAADGPSTPKSAGDYAPAAVTVSEQDRALVARGRGLLGLTDATVVLPAEEVSEGGAGGDFVLLGLTRCRVVLLGRLRALRIAGLRGCTVVSGPVTGACFVDDVRASSLSLATYQVRVHRTASTDLFLRVRSKPIIEHSTGIRVAPWPAAVVPEPRLQRLLEEHMLGEETGCWQQVDDFGWIKAVQSPNWRVMAPEEYPPEPLVVPEAAWGPVGRATGFTKQQQGCGGGGSGSGGGGELCAAVASQTAAAAEAAAGDEDEI